MLSIINLYSGLGGKYMLLDFAWNAFEMTGNPDMYVFYREVSNLKSKEETQPENGEKNTLEG